MHQINNVLIPTNEKFVEEVAKAISKDFLYRDASSLIQSSLGINISQIKHLEDRFDKEFEMLWSSPDEESIAIREGYRQTAITAINKINLLLLTSDV